MNKTSINKFVAKWLQENLGNYNYRLKKNGESVFFDLDIGRISISSSVINYKPNFYIGFTIGLRIMEIESIFCKFYFEEKESKKRIEEATTVAAKLFKDSEISFSKSNYGIKISSFDDLEKLMSELKSQMESEIYRFISNYSELPNIEQWLNRNYFNPTTPLILPEFKGMIAAKLLEKEYFEDLIKFNEKCCLKTSNNNIGFYPVKFNALVSYLKSLEKLA